MIANPPMPHNLHDPPAVHPHLAALPGYEPVVPLVERCRRAGVALADALKLDANENPFGVHPEVRAALRKALADGGAAPIYPDPLQLALREALGERLGVPSEWVIAGAGMDEPLDLVMRAAVPPGRSVVASTPCFGMYRFLADVNQLPFVEVPRASEFRIELEPLLEAAASSDGAPAGLMIITSPNNPTGDLFPRAALEALLDTGATVLLDEAYIEFARGPEAASAVELLERYPRLIVARTFSKWAGIAGLRLGYVACHPSLVEALLKVKQPYNINAAAEAAGLAALRAADALNAQADRIVETRERLIAALAEYPQLRPYPSQANFVLVRVAPLGEDAGATSSAGREFHDALARQGVFVRFYSDRRLRNCVRISAPRPDQLDTLLERIARVLS